MQALFIDVCVCAMQMYKPDIDIMYFTKTRK